MKRIIGILVTLSLAILVSCDLPIMRQLNNPNDPKASPSPSASPESPSVSQTITLLAIPGVVAPVRGAVPVTTGIDTAQYSGSIAWSPADSTFAASTVYTANIILSPKTGWTLTGIAANSFTVEGATAMNPSLTGTVAAVFPATGAAPTNDYSSATIGILKYVPAGSFQRDATATNISTITTAFRMSEHEITRAQFTAILSTDPSNPTYSGGNSDPVQMSNWYHAIAFCNKLSLAESLTPVYSVTGINFSTLTYAGIPTAANADWDAATANWTATGYRLPTEMEWMWAAMGATSDRFNGYTGTGTNTSGYNKAFAGSTGSNAIGDYAVFGYGHGETGATTTLRSNPVGSKLPNEIGLYDITGNVFEWNWDWSAAYPSGSLIDYRGAASGTSRMLRGGSWGFHSTNCTVAYRDYPSFPYTQNLNFGFRVVRP